MCVCVCVCVCLCLCVCVCVFTHVIFSFQVLRTIHSLEHEQQRDFIQKCLIPDQSQRPRTTELLFHPVLFEVHSLKLLAAHALIFKPKCKYHYIYSNYLCCDSNIILPFILIFHREYFFIIPLCWPFIYFILIFWGIFVFSHSKPYWIEFIDLIVFFPILSKV